ncbi:Longitudinals lacking protein, isoforms A/B/D/L [Harpegnathos saltator]|uniref:Longitudinals lacking protein, isoforms A/B/D/L n=1 Tax=Harpegnathos saltator TaxID=610380 RepID=E2BJC8_HARSA|nr:Longitudinals lacking protein, isoforms A/B/D/L [Harpegnathos saltator]
MSIDAKPSAERAADEINDLTVALSATCFRNQEGALPRQLRLSLHVSQMRQTLHVDGLLDEASTRGLRHAAKVQLYALRQKVQTQGLPPTPREQRSSVHNSSDYYKRLGRHFCTTCGKEYKWMQSLIRHEREECGKEPQHSCPVCGAKIRHKWMLKKHLINVHKWVIPNGKNF